MPEYDIPLSTVYNEGEGNRVIIKNDTVYIVSRFGDQPHDLISIQDSEAEELVHILTAYLARARDDTLGVSPTGCRFADYRTDGATEDTDD